MPVPLPPPDCFDSVEQMAFANPPASEARRSPLYMTKPGTMMPAGDSVSTSPFEMRRLRQTGLVKSENVQGAG